MPGPHTLRGDGRALLVGHDAIAGFRSARARIPTRAVVALHVHVIAADAALVLASTRDGAATGLQTQLWRLADGLPAEPGDLHIDKYRMSGFWDTPLDSVLRNLRVDTLLFAGVNSDQCGYATLVDAACLGYDVVLLTDASATTSPSYCHDATLYNVRQCYGFTATTPDLLAALAGAGPLTPKDTV
jgi:nicotinamidase-related amidase